jgi:hypothetical protein
MVAANPQRLTPYATTSCHALSALPRQQRHLSILYRSASEPRSRRKEEKHGKQIDPRNQSIAEWAPTPLSLSRHHAEPVGRRCAQARSRQSWGSRLAAFVLCARRNVSGATESSVSDYRSKASRNLAILDIPVVRHSRKPSAREF